jgi:hypothetical protein
MSLGGFEPQKIASGSSHRAMRWNGLCTQKGLDMYGNVFFAHTSTFRMRFVGIYRWSPSRPAFESSRVQASCNLETNKLRVRVRIDNIVVCVRGRRLEYVDRVRRNLTRSPKITRKPRKTYRYFDSHKVPARSGGSGRRRRRG